jgi:glycosyltransferase involved in cell wall biosynthesis/GT2 family glycosyltransferase
MSARLPSRPPVSVVMPFSGDARAAMGALDAMALISVETADKLILVDNSPTLAAVGLAAIYPHVSVLTAPRERSSYYARNVGAANARGEWMLFIDSDCVPEPHILSAYFAEPPDERLGALAGEVVGDPRQDAVLARYQRHYGHLGQRAGVTATKPWAATANLLVRRAAWRSVGGFAEGIRSGGDRDFTYRLAEAGWSLGYRPQARVTHRHRDTLPAFAALMLRYGAGLSWLYGRYPDARSPRPADGSAVRAAASSLHSALTGDRCKSALRAIDALVIALDRLGSWGSNRAPKENRHRSRAQLVVLADRFPELSETFVAQELAALARLGVPVAVEAAGRGHRCDPDTQRANRVDYREDDSILERMIASAWLVACHPGACVRDLITRRRWRREEVTPPLRALAPVARRISRGNATHLHAHFADGAALTAMRLGLLTGLPYSVTAHAYEIFQTPRNLREKLERAAFVTTGCRYNVEHLQRLAPGACVHLIVMGVDLATIRRTTPYPGGSALVAVGRLVPKKGFAVLLEAARILREAGRRFSLQIIGDGPLRQELMTRIGEGGLASHVHLTGALSHQETLDRIEASDLLVMPSIIDASGDRDSMPVVVKEALALEVPVIASDVAGLPEVVMAPWGRLVPPGDPEALACGVDRLLDVAAAERMVMGRAGREHVARHCNVDVETQRLIQLIQGDADALVPLRR